MDGDLYLIRLMKKRPILWDKSWQENRDLDARAAAWKEVAEAVNAEVSWIRPRWYNLRERFVRELKLPCKPKFKYFQEMQFLVDHVEFRKKPSKSWCTRTCATKKVSQQEQLSAEENTLEDSEFVISQKQIDELDVEEAEYIFEEIIDYTNLNIESNKRDLTVDEYTNTNHSSKSILVSESLAEEQKLSKPSDSENYEEILEPPSKRQDCSIKIETKDAPGNLESNLVKRTEITEARCEDTIFGELVVAMLKKMDEVKKKSVKRDIMNILLS